MVLHPSKHFLVGKALKKLFGVALLLWRECIFVVSKSGPSTVDICRNQVYAFHPVRRVITGVEQPDSLACVAACGWTWTEDTQNSDISSLLTTLQTCLIWSSSLLPALILKTCWYCFCAQKLNIAALLEVHRY